VTNAKSEIFLCFAYAARFELRISAERLKRQSDQTYFTWKWCESDWKRCELSGKVMWKWCENDVKVMWKWCESDVKGKWCESDVKVMWKWCESEVKVMWKLCESDVKVMWKWDESDVKVMWKWCKSEMKVMWKWCESDVKVTDPLIPMTTILVEIKVRFGCYKSINTFPRLQIWGGTYSEVRIPSFAFGRLINK